MANANIVIRRKVGADTYDVLHPQTVIGQVVGLQSALDAKISTTARGAANGVAPLGSDSKVPLANLPGFLSGAGKGFHLVGSLGTNTSLNDLVIALSSLAVGGANYENLYGYFWVATGSINITWTDQTALNPNTFHVLLPGDEGDTTSPVTLEAGDMIVFTKYSNTSGDGDDFEFSFSVINNSHQAATTTASGVVVLSDRSFTSQLAGNDVITETSLGSLLTDDGTDLYNNGTPIQYKIAPSSHTHSQYQPLDATLTNFAGLTITGDTLVYGSGNDTFTTTAFTSFGRTLVSQTNASTTRTELGVYSAGQVDTLITNATENKVNIYYDLDKTTADSITTPIGSYIYDDLSTSNGW